MQRLVRPLVFLLLLPFSSVLASDKNEQLSPRDLSLFTECVRSRSWDMLGSKQFATGDTVTVKYSFTMRGAQHEKQNLYLAFVTRRGDLGRVFLLRKFKDGWWVVNDANFETTPHWKLSSEPLGGGNVAGLMGEALAKMEQDKRAEAVRLLPIGKQPQGCSTYLQK